MFSDYCHQAVAELKQQGITFAPGLTDDEVRELEETFRFRFPPDLLMFLRTGVPASDGFAAWRSAEDLKDHFDVVVDRILSDIEHSGIWRSLWGPRPHLLGDALDLAGQHLRQSPVLVPVYICRYMPAEPQEAGNPIFSAYGIDMIHYGNDLPGYLSREFGIRCPSWAAKSPRPVRFWDYFLAEVYDDNPHLGSS